ncbi:hypothetical protein CWB89_21175 [Pseudoalteromonas piscicida]|uniref:Uncharacterized protein n=1 Tax=Pseudoalteromonas piscicida TaxID=43662 RepID=A0AAQ2ET14_PSEO7|nr:MULTISPECIES: hypothetical protein [Pseudoalteromonas]KJY88689.1 hypothetical protein TW75_11800 [Pseudoalteromonas piscicida]MDP4490048.1 hypothetical protein [Pseudoalteromonas piscicida]TMN35226.1 hypothetical protein CWB94_21065 [Pseudoalteromonas piscicida]TMN42237.1 hypothetical protein CWB95_07670 [Pseudoalteromonas piscicida]TMN48821.1 hypothetical protein CWB91_18085 [Pseudoalteromonas piscicida]
MKKFTMTGIVLALSPMLSVASSDLPLPSGFSDSLERGNTVIHSNRQLITKSEMRASSATVFAETNQQTTAITLRCPTTLNINTSYPLGGAQTGGSDCFHFKLDNPSKLYAFVTAQNAQTNVNLTLIRHKPDDTLTVIGASSNEGGLDELITTVSQAGDYYWLLDYVQADGGEFNFGVMTSESIDSNELNDTIAESTILPDQLNKVVGNLDSILDVDHYAFEAKRGQEVLLKFLDPGNTGEFVLEHLEAGAWVEVPLAKGKLITPAQAGEYQIVRVRPNYSLPNNPASAYQLTLGSNVASFSQHSIEGESNVLRVPYAAQSSPYMTTQAYQKLKWNVTLQDSKGHPVPGGQALLFLWRDYYNRTTSNFELTPAVADAQGKISQVIDLGRCVSGNGEALHTEYSGGYTNEWYSQYQIGAWRVEIPSGLEGSIGIGGNRHPIVTLGHICDQDLLSSTRQ